MVNIYIWLWWWLMIVNNNLVGGWPIPLKNDGLRQLGLWNSQLNGKILDMFQTTNQSTTPLGMVEANHTISWKQFFHNFAAEQHWKGRPDSVLCLVTHAMCPRRVRFLPHNHAISLSHWAITGHHCRSPLLITWQNWGKWKQCHISVLWVKPNLPNKSC